MLTDDVSNFDTIMDRPFLIHHAHGITTGIPPEHKTDETSRELSFRSIRSQR
jgi:hypothetical protein